MSVCTCLSQGEDETALRQCYEGVERDGEVIRVRDTVLLRSGPRKKSLPYVAKISALWEDPKTGRGGDQCGIPWIVCMDGWIQGHMAEVIYLYVCVCVNLLPQES